MLAHHAFNRAIFLLLRKIPMNVAPLRALI